MPNISEQKQREEKHSEDAPYITRRDGRVIIDIAERDRLQQDDEKRELHEERESQRRRDEANDAQRDNPQRVDPVRVDPVRVNPPSVNSVRERYGVFADYISYFPQSDSDNCSLSTQSNSDCDSGSISAQSNSDGDSGSISAQSSRDNNSLFAQSNSDNNSLFAQSNSDDDSGSLPESYFIEQAERFRRQDEADQQEFDEMDRLRGVDNQQALRDRIQRDRDEQWEIERLERERRNDLDQSGNGMSGGLQDVNRMLIEVAEEEAKRAEDEEEEEEEEAQTSPIDYMIWASSPEGIRNIRGFLTTGPADTQGERNLEFFQIFERYLINLNDPASAVEYLHSVLAGVGFSGTNINRILNEGMPRMRNVFNNLYRN